MEENKNNNEKAEVSYEQLKTIALQAQQTAYNLKERLQNIDMVSLRLTWLFKVIENKTSFNKDFINKCSSEIENLLTIEESNEQDK